MDFSKFPRRHLVARYIFPGFPAFLEAAAKQLGHREAVSPARRISILTAVAKLCAQASIADLTDSRVSWKKPLSSAINCGLQRELQNS